MTRTSVTLLAAAFAASCLTGAAAATGGHSSSGPTLRVALNAHLHRQIVVDAAGRTLYMFTLDPKNTSICTANSPAPDCSKIWRPLVAVGTPRVGAGLAPGKVGTTKRGDGRVQVTYNGHPLYRFTGYPGTPADTKPGDMHGQGFFSDWYVLSPTGRPIKAG
jgi:predicted lipoprotein with Yx(FWY)xxD motif